MPIVPAYGCENYGIPVVRRNAEAWRHFDVVGMIENDYSLPVEGHGKFNLPFQDLSCRSNAALICESF